jgi:hypothetical protein
MLLENVFPGHLSVRVTGMGLLRFRGTRLRGRRGRSWRWAQRRGLRKCQVRAFRVICKETKVMGATTLSITAFSITTLSIKGHSAYTAHNTTMVCHNAEYFASFFIMLNDIMLSVIMLNVVLLSVVAPKQYQCYKTLTNVFSVCPW